ncbi:MAG: paraquat-inducible protein A [Pseudomonadota bacterium]
MKPDPDLSRVLACRQCDALYPGAPPLPGERAECPRCHAVIAAPRRQAGIWIIVVSFGILVLAGLAMFLPFLSIRRFAIGNTVSLFDTVAFFAPGGLAILVSGLVLGVPLTRAVINLYVLGPLVAGRAPAFQASRAFLISERLRPFAMAEIFVIGCAIALAKLGSFARVEIGPAFWIFGGMAALTVLVDRMTCSWTIWNALDQTTRS